jgi:hypothetical protein
MSVEWRLVDGEVRGYAKHQGEEIEVGWSPQPGSQSLFLTCPVFECLYEGTRGPGKTDALIMDFAQHCGARRNTPDGRQWSGFGQEWRGILFRQSYPQLADVIMKTKKWLPRLFAGIKFNEAKSTWHWPTGESLRLGFIQKEQDYWNYHGHQYPWIGWEELTTWASSDVYRKMMSCCRSPVPAMPRKYRATTNPYGPGHNWVKARFKLPVPSNNVVGNLVAEDGEPERIALHGHLDENRILLLADPGYKDRIKAAARSKAELEAWLHGSWDIVAGGMFDDVWEPKYHVIPAFVVPESWRIDRSFDWGSSKPFSVGWWAESDGTDLVFPNGRMMRTVRGDLFRIHEWYGCTSEPNEGLRMLAADIAKGVIEREVTWGMRRKVAPGPADSAIFAVENGASIATDMSRYGVRWTRADKRPGSRKTGWEQMRRMFRDAIPQGNKPRENPGLFVVDHCDNFLRTVPVLPRDLSRDPDDVDTDSEDHIADEVRYRVRFIGQRAKPGSVIGTV